ncbi:MAG: hypothetical protein WEA76_04425 [Acidimicrobiia bacterium]
MTTNDAERVLELEEAADGVELFRPPGDALQMEKARDQAEASGWTPEPEVEPNRPETGRLASIRDRRDALRVAMHSLETTVAGPASAMGWREAVAAALAAIREALEAHISLVERPSGLLEEILEIAPRLAYATEEIEAEHIDILRLLSRAADLVDQGGQSRDIRRSAMSLLAALAIHRQRGSDLIYEAYSVDLGTGY